MFACIYIPDFPVCAVTRGEPELASRAVAIVDGTPPVANVVAMNEQAHGAGVKLGMPKLTVAGIDSVAVRHRSPAAEASTHAALLDLGLAFSPRVEETALDTVVLDLAGLDRLIGPPEEAARRLAKRALELGLDANTALAANPDAAVHAARGFPGVTLIPAGEESERLGPLPIEVLAPPPETLDTLRRWGVHTLRALAALPTPELSERLGQLGVTLQKLARGTTSRPLVPAEATLRFEEAMELEYPIELLEPLAFILGHLLDRLCARLTARSLAANEIRLQLGLQSSVANSKPETGNSKFESGVSPRSGRNNVAHGLSRRWEEPSLTPVPSPARAGEGYRRRDEGLETQGLRPGLSYSTPDGASPQSPVPSPSSSQSSIVNRQSSIRLPVATRNSKLLLKLLLLNLQSDPPPAPVVKVTLQAEPVKPRVAQGELFLPLSPDPEKLELTLARIAGVVGKGNVGSPELLDTHRPDAFRMNPFGSGFETRKRESGVGSRESQRKTGLGIRDSGFAEKDSQPAAVFRESRSSSANPEPPTSNPGSLALRVFRPPLAAKVQVRDVRPVRVDASEVRGDVILAAGPWRTSGDWWTDEPWDREEWDVTVLSVVRGSWPVAMHRDSGFGVRGSQTARAAQPTKNESADFADYADEKGGIERQEGRQHLHNLQIESSVFRTKETTLCRIYCDLRNGSWFVEGFYD